MLWFDEADHADVCERRRWRREVVQEILWRSAMGAAAVAGGE